MVRLSRHGRSFSILTTALLLAIATTAGLHLVFKTSEPAPHPDGFLAYGAVSVTILSSDVDTLKAKRCIANSAQAGIDVRQGTPIVISLEGRAVGGGDLSTGELKREMETRGRFELDGAICQYKFAAPVTRPGRGQYTVDIGEAKIAFSMEDLRKGILLQLS